MQTNPIHATQPILDMVRIDEQKNPITAATAMKIAVHVPWLVSALRQVEIEINAEPAANT